MTQPSAYAMTRATQVGWGAAQTVGLLMAAAVLLAGFVAIELRSKAPILPMRIFGLRTLTGANVASLLLGAATNLAWNPAPSPENRNAH